MLVIAMDKRSRNNTNQSEGITRADSKNPKVKSIEKLDAKHHPHDKDNAKWYY
jgi:hypothetical protein